MIKKNHSGITMELNVVLSERRDGIYVHLTEPDLKFLWSLSINYLLQLL